MKQILTESQLRNTINECVRDIMYETIRNRVKQVIRENIKQRLIIEYQTEEEKKETEQNKREQKRLSHEEKVLLVKNFLNQPGVNKAAFAYKLHPDYTPAAARSALEHYLNGTRDWPEGAVDKLYNMIQNM